MDKEPQTQVGRALQAKEGSDRVDAGLLARGYGAARSAFPAPCRRYAPGTRLAGITDMFACQASQEGLQGERESGFGPRRLDRGTAFVPFTGALDDILCIHAERTVSRKRCPSAWHFEGRRRARFTAAISGQLKAWVRVHGCDLRGTMAVFRMDRDVWRDTTADGQPSTAKLMRPRDPLRRDRRRVESWNSRLRERGFPAHGPETVDRSGPELDMVHKRLYVGSDMSFIHDKQINSGLGFPLIMANRHLRLTSGP